MKSFFGSPRTTAGAVIAVCAVVSLLAHAIDMTAAVTLLGVAATWIGIAGKDAGGVE
jgi:hypothetical protein